MQGVTSNDIICAMFIEPAQAELLTGKSPSTIQRWVRSNKVNRQAVDEHGRINQDLLRKDYPFIVKPQMESSDINARQQELEAGKLSVAKEQQQVIRHQLESLTEIVEAKQQTIDRLIDKQKKPNYWTIVSIIAVSTTCLVGFYLYRSELIEHNDNELASQRRMFRTERNALKEQLDYQSQKDTYVIEQLQGDIERLRAELKQAKQDKATKELPMIMHWGAE